MGTENGSSIKANKSGLAQKCISVLIKGIYYLFPDALKMGNQLHPPPRVVWEWGSQGAAGLHIFFCTFVTKMIIRNSRKILTAWFFQDTFMIPAMRHEESNQRGSSISFFFFFFFPSYARRAFMSSDTNHIRWVAAKSFFIYYGASSHSQKERKKDPVRVQGRLPCH